MKFITKLSTIILTLTIIILFAQCSGANSKLDSELKAASEGLNKQCPVDVNEYTRFDKTEILPNKSFRFHFSLLDDSFSEMSKGDVNMDEASPQSSKV